jgi:hypothetical protein
MREAARPTLDEHGDERHPAWGRMTVTRGQGTPVALFDSDIKHQHTVNVALHTATRKRDLHRDWIHTGKQKFEIQMSESQWAAFVASVGQGSGTSCTIRFDRSQDDPIVPGVVFESRLKQSSDEIRSAAKEAIENIVEAFKKVEEKPNQGNVRALGFAIQNLPSNLGFAADSLTEHMEQVVSKARADIEAMVTTMAAERGLDPGKLDAKELMAPEEER